MSWNRKDFDTFVHGPVTTRQFTGSIWNMRMVLEHRVEIQIKVMHKGSHHGSVLRTSYIDPSTRPYGISFSKCRKRPRYAFYMFVHLPFPRSRFYAQKGFATFLLSLAPVSGSLYSFQLTGYIALPASLVAMITPR